MVGVTAGVSGLPDSSRKTTVWPGVDIFHSIKLGWPVIVIGFGVASVGASGIFTVTG
jgi:hypothetical protein